jgi:hypothetical protein
MKYPTGRLIFRVVLLVAFGTALAVPILVFVLRGMDHAETWTVTAAALAVLTSIVSAWSTRTIVELQEDAKRPNPVPTFDLGSRYDVALFRVRNVGGTAAYDISFDWTTELKTVTDGKTIGFSKASSTPAISVLPPGESISQIIGLSSEFVRAHPDGEYTGFMSFQDASGYRYRRSFRLDGRSYKGAARYADESLRTHYELQQLPHKLAAIQSVLETIAQKIR